MSVFADTSAFYAVFDADDEEHPRAREAWDGLISAETPLLTSNYVLVETTALLQNRLGIGAVRAFDDAVSPLLRGCGWTKNYTGWPSRPCSRPAVGVSAWWTAPASRSCVVAGSTPPSPSTTTSPSKVSAPYPERTGR